MKHEKRSISRGVALAACACMFLFLGCAHKAKHPAGPLETPEHHVFNGQRLLAEKDMEAAAREFRLALELDPNSSPAFEGLGLALAGRGDFAAAFDAMEKARRKSRNPQERAMAHVGFVRLHTMQKEEGWLSAAREHHEKAQKLVKELPENHYYLGLALQDAGLHDEAAREFGKVLSMNQKLVREADERLREVQKIQRALPGSGMGRGVVVEEKITRAQLAALLHHELRVDKIHALQSGEKAPLRSIPEDIRDHPLRTGIEAVLRVRIRGLELFPDGRFEPDGFVTRAQFAMIMEDLVSTLSHDPGLPSRYLGGPSPFPDVPEHVPYFNAVMFCTTRGLMEVSDLLTGAFRPADQVRGADALLMVRMLRERARIF